MSEQLKIYHKPQLYTYGKLEEVTKTQLAGSWDVRPSETNRSYGRAADEARRSAMTALGRARRK